MDNFTEFKRSKEAPEYFIKAYETNMLILIEEYVTLMDQDEFIKNENGIKTILEDLANVYIFEDIGFSLKNYANWGYRSSGEIVALDIGYVYPIKGNEGVLSCPRCKGHLKYNQNYTGFQCSNNGCRTKYTFLDIRRRMDLSLEDFEDRMISELNNVEMPDFDTINETIASEIERSSFSQNFMGDVEYVSDENGNIDLYKMIDDHFNNE